jgi:hypothetical protein
MNNEPDSRLKYGDSFGVTISIQDLLLRWNANIKLIDELCFSNKIKPYRDSYTGFSDTIDGNDVIIFSPTLANENYIDGDINDCPKFQSLPDDTFFYMPDILSFEDLHPEVKKSLKNFKTSSIAPADYNKWVKADLWTIECAILLLINVEYLPREPGIYDCYSSAENELLVRKQFMDIWNIAESSLKTGTLTKIDKGRTGLWNEVLPKEFIRWANLKGFLIPAELSVIDLNANTEENNVIDDKLQLNTEAFDTKTKNLKNKVEHTSIFAQFKNLHANEISLVVMEDHSVNLFIRRKKIKANPHQLGLKHGLQNWKLFEGSAVNEGNMKSALKKLNSTTKLETEKGKISTAVFRLNNALKKAMGLVDYPVICLEGCYTFIFKTMTHEYLYNGKISKGADAMDHLDENQFDNNKQRSNKNFWNDDEDTENGENYY